jgi:hypothetical protein
MMRIFILLNILLLLAMIPWLMIASEAMSACEVKHSYETCAYSLR